MFTAVKRRGMATLAALGIILLGSGTAEAQFGVIGPGANPYVAPGLTLRQYLANAQAIGRTFGTLPPWTYNYNPLVVGRSPQPFRPPVAPFVPFAPPAAVPGAVIPPGGFVNPYLPGAIDPFAGALTNPYVPSLAGGYDGGLTNPYYPYGETTVGGALRGTADVLRGYGDSLIRQSQAQILHEQWRQARLETLKKRFEYEMWIRANTPTFTEEQAKVARIILKRVQTNASPSQVLSARSLNILLDDLRKHPLEKVQMDEVTLPEDVLKHLNVTKTDANLGILRNDGRFTWPAALQDLLTQTEQKEIQVQAERLVNQARNGKPDPNVLRDFANQLKRIGDELQRNVNQIPTDQYLEAKRFLSDMADARRALETTDAIPYFEFQAFVAKGPSLQQVVDYMVSRGLRFAPAIAGDEAAYQAVHSALAAYDVALNTQLASGNGRGGVKE